MRRNGNAGMIGWLPCNLSVISQCSNTGTIEGTGGYTAGLISSMGCRIGTMVDCYNAGKIIAGGSHMVGGIISNATQITTIERCYNTGKIMSTSGAGGLIGSIGKYGGGTYVIERISECYNTGTIEAKGEYVAGLIGYSYNIDTITNCYNSGEIINNTTQTTSYTGGMIGQSNIKTMQQCSNTVPITTSEKVGYTGGLVGEKCGTRSNENELFEINNCYNTGDIIGNHLGGIIAVTSTASPNLKATIQDCSNEGNLNGEGHVGGIIGYHQIETEKIENCTNKGSINGKLVVAGILAEITKPVLLVDGCSNQGIIQTTTGSTFGIGGILGNIKVDQNVIIKNSNNQAKIDGGSANYTGGIIGGILLPYDTKTVQIVNCYNTAEITGNGETVAGIVGYCSNEISFTDCNNNATINGKQSVAGIVGYVAYKFNLQSVINSGEIIGYKNVGGIIGDFRASSGKESISVINNCSNSGVVRQTVTIDEGTYGCGGIVGYSAGGTIEIANTSNMGEIVSSYVGEIIGYNAGSVIIYK